MYKLCVNWCLERLNYQPTVNYFIILKYELFTMYKKTSYHFAVVVLLVSISLYIKNDLIEPTERLAKIDRELNCHPLKPMMRAYACCDILCDLDCQTFPSDKIPIEGPTCDKIPSRSLVSEFHCNDTTCPQNVVRELMCRNGPRNCGSIFTNDHLCHKRCSHCYDIMFRHSYVFDQFMHIDSAVHDFGRDYDRAAKSFYETNSTCYYNGTNVVFQSARNSSNNRRSYDTMLITYYSCLCFTVSYVFVSLILFVRSLMRDRIMKAQ